MSDLRVTSVDQSEADLRQRLEEAERGRSTFTIADMIEVGLSFYDEVRVAGVADHGDGDMLLYQYGRASSGSGLLEVDLVRQFMVPRDEDDDCISQLHLSALVQVKSELLSLPPFNVWCSNPGQIPNFRRAIETSPNYAAVRDVLPRLTTVEYELV